MPATRQPIIARKIAVGVVATGILTAFAALVLTARKRRTTLRSLLQSLLRRTPRRPAFGPGSFAALRDAILGTTKQSISQVFGPPPTASLATLVKPADTVPYWHANVWYYPLDPHERSGMAIEFANDQATKIELIKMPRGRRPF